MKLDVLGCHRGERTVRASILAAISWQDQEVLVENVLLKLENLHKPQGYIFFSFL